MTQVRPIITAIVLPTFHGRASVTYYALILRAHITHSLSVREQQVP